MVIQGECLHVKCVNIISKSQIDHGDDEVPYRSTEGTDHTYIPPYDMMHISPVLVQKIVQYFLTMGFSTKITHRI